MPTYDYVCKACGASLDMFQSMTERPKRKCPKCGELQLKRLIGTGAGIVFKGSGFYQTDYRSKSYSEGEKKAKPEKAKTDETKKSKPSASENKPKKGSGKDE